MAILTELAALLIPIIAIFFVFAFPLLVIYLDYKKKIFMIEKGLPEEENRPEDRLGWGIAILGIGISLIIGWTFNLGANVIIGLILTFIGLALLISYLIIKIKK